MTDQQASTAQPAAEPASQPIQNNFTIPDTYKDRGWVEKIKSPDDLWKTLDNAQSLLGKRPAGIPAADAPQEEWDRFYQVARPESPDKYTLSDIEGIPEGFDIAPIKQQAADLAYKAGLTPKQANDLWNEYMKTELGAAEKNKKELDAQREKGDAEFESLMTKLHGDKYAEVQQTALDMVNQYIPADLVPATKELADNPRALAALVTAMKGAHDEIAKLKAEYGAEGSLTRGAQSPTANIEDTRKELAQLRTSAAAKDFLSPDHKKTMERVSELSKIVENYYNKK